MRRAGRALATTLVVVLVALAVAGVVLHHAGSPAEPVLLAASFAMFGVALAVPALALALMLRRPLLAIVAAVLVAIGVWTYLPQFTPSRGPDGGIGRHDSRHHSDVLAVARQPALQYQVGTERNQSEPPTNRPDRRWRPHVVWVPVGAVGIRVFEDRSGIGERAVRESCHNRHRVPGRDVVETIVGARVRVIVRVTPRIALGRSLIARDIHDAGRTFNRDVDTLRRYVEVIEDVPIELL